MSHLLWASFYEDDVDTFRQLLAAPAGFSKIHVRGGITNISTSPSAATTLGTSPTLLAKNRKVSSHGTVSAAGDVTRAGINMRDACGLTLLHHIASSSSANARTFAQALLELQYIDLYLQDYESGWTALHRAFYFGNVAIARMILEREADTITSRKSSTIHAAKSLIKIKDREGLGPLDLYAATITDRTLRPGEEPRPQSPISEQDDGEARQTSAQATHASGDEVYTFGSNKNITLGFGDEDDRQFPERIVLRRPDSLIRRFHAEMVEQRQETWSSYQGMLDDMSTATDSVPWLTKMRPIEIKEAFMSKFHTAVLTSDPESNLYMCGHGQGGRLGTGDEQTRFHFVCIDSGVLSHKHISAIALGHHHTLAVTNTGEIFSWGNNAFGQLGYTLPKSAIKDEDPISTVPRQIFGPLKREEVVGVAASSIHSVAFTGAGLYTFGKNEGQLGIVDSDARSLDIQTAPRRVAASLFNAPIDSVSAIDKATICLLASHEVWVFANYGYMRVTFPLEGFTNYFLKQSFLVTSYDKSPNRVVKVTAGGDTVCAMSSRGEIFTFRINRNDTQSFTSTTNPTKIRSAITSPQCVWSLKKGNMAARDVGVDADGSIILSTEEGSVWKRDKRAHMKDAIVRGADHKAKDYKFSRIPGLTRVLAVRGSAYGAYAAVRKDCDVAKNQIIVEDRQLWKNVARLSPLLLLADTHRQTVLDQERPRFWQAAQRVNELAIIKQTILESTDIESLLKEKLEMLQPQHGIKYDSILMTSASELQIPVHRWLLAGRSKVLRLGFRDLCATSTFTIPELCVSEIDSQGLTVVKFAGLDILTVIDIVLYLYTDTIVDFWHRRDAKENAYRYRHIRLELMKVAAKLDLLNLEPAVRQMIEPRTCLNMDLAVAAEDPPFFHDADINVQLEDGELQLHSALVCARCPFFEGLFAGRAGGRWLAGRYEDDAITVDLTHISKATFQLVLQHLYSDAGPELFAEVMADELEDFLDIVLDVLSAANELMLDRLSQICQAVIGKFVNARNVCWLLNAISPSSVHEFKHASLEYLCLNLEAMLQGHYLNELEEDLLEELDEVARQNQLNCMPFAKSSYMEVSLRERHPELATKLDQSRQARVDAMHLRAKFQEMQTLQPGSLEKEYGHFTPSKSRRRSSQQMKTDERPGLRSKASTKDMMFAMDEETHPVNSSPAMSPSLQPSTTPNLGPVLSASLDDQWYDSRGKLLSSPTISAQKSSMHTPKQNVSSSGTPQTPRSPMLGGKTPPQHSSPWTLTPLPAAKTDLKGIMAQASGNSVSILSHKLSGGQSISPDASMMSAGINSKMSQKERKRMLQQPKQSPSGISEQIVQESPSKASPWQTVSSPKIRSLKEVLEAQKPSAEARPAIIEQSISTPQLTMRQTLARTPPPPPSSALQVGTSLPSQSTQKRSISQQHAKGSSKTSAQSNVRVASGARHVASPATQSINYEPRIVESTLQLSISDIVAQQQLEKDIVRQAVAKRDLQDIQAEQEFQEWWDKETRRVQEAEREAHAPAKAPRRPKVRQPKSNGRAGKAKS